MLVRYDLKCYIKRAREKPFNKREKKMINDLYTDADLLLTDEKLYDMMYDMQEEINALEMPLLYAKENQAFRTKIGWFLPCEARGLIAKKKDQLANLNAQLRNWVPRKIDQTLRREKILQGTYCPPEMEIIASHMGSKKIKILQPHDEGYGALSNYCPHPDRYMPAD